MSASEEAARGGRGVSDQVGPESSLLSPSSPTPGLRALEALVDEEIALLERKAILLDGMARCVREGELGRLEALLEQEAGFREEDERLEQRREELRRAVAAETGLRPEEVTLGGLVEQLGGAVSIALSDRRQRLLEMIRTVRERSRITTRLIRSASRFNDRLLGELLGGGEETRTYSPGGAFAGPPRRATFQHSA